MKKSQVDLENSLVHIPDSPDTQRNGGHADDKNRLPGVQSADGGDAWLRVPFPHAEEQRGQAVHHNAQEPGLLPCDELPSPTSRSTICDTPSPADSVLGAFPTIS